MAAMVRRIKLGSQGPKVSAAGLGCVGMSPFSGPPKSDPDMITLNIRRTLDCGVTILDTSDVYGSDAHEILRGKIGF